MGFFSRLFQPRADGQPVTDDWTSLPDSQASELVLMDEEAVRLMAEFDIDSAIASHERWLPWLSQALRVCTMSACVPRWYVTTAAPNLASGCMAMAAPRSGISPLSTC